MDKDVPVSVWPEWELIEKIGEGSFGKVYKAKRTERGRSFYSAIKIISIPASKGELDSVRSEMNNEQSTREYSKSGRRLHSGNIYYGAFLRKFPCGFI